MNMETYSMVFETECEMSAQAEAVEALGGEIIYTGNENGWWVVQYEVEA